MAARPTRRAQQFRPGMVVEVPATAFGDAFAAAHVGMTFRGTILDFDVVDDEGSRFWNVQYDDDECPTKEQDMTIVASGTEQLQEEEEEEEGGSLPESDAAMSGASPNEEQSRSEEEEFEPGSSDEEEEEEDEEDEEESEAEEAPEAEEESDGDFVLVVSKKTRKQQKKAASKAASKASSKGAASTEVDEKDESQLVGGFWYNVVAVYDPVHSCWVAILIQFKMLIWFMQKNPMSVPLGFMYKHHVGCFVPVAGASWLKTLLANLKINWSDIRKESSP